MRYIFIYGIIITITLFLCYQLKSIVPVKSSFIEKTGMVTGLCGVFLSWKTYRIVFNIMKPKHFNVDEQPLYSHGPFRYCRHPFHTSFFLMALGSGLYISGHWIAAPLMFLMLGSAMHPLMSRNEKILQQKYGDIYIYWCRHRFRLVPFVY